MESCSTCVGGPLCPPCESVTEFLSRCLDGDEIWARAASTDKDSGGAERVIEGGAQWLWMSDSQDRVPTVPFSGSVLEESPVTLTALRGTPGEEHIAVLRCGEGSSRVPSGVAGHVVRHDPASVMLRVEVQRRLLEMCRKGDVPPEVVLLMVQPYRGHPGFDASWQID